MKFTFQPESRPLDGYTIKRAIHRGGFGEVYYALTDAGKEVALKLLKQHLDVELRGVSQCLNLKHANLVTIFDVKEDADGDHWVIMEFVAGKSLAQVLDGHLDGLPIDDVQKWLAGMADGLSFLHDRGIVHRDLKPGNVFLENGVVKIGDIGLSKFISESHRSAQTQSVGTVYYMAPEVAHGRYGREVDVYSLGIVAYELLTGRVPFVGESAGEILMKHLSEKPDLSPIPRRLRPVLAQALEKDPLRRTATAAQLYEDFRRAAAGIDVPQEIPEESFLHPTMADSSAIDRERQSSRPASPEFKEIFAGDVARAMAMAEKAARAAKQMAERARRGSRSHRRAERHKERWARRFSRYGATYPTFWGRGNCASRKSPERRPNAAPTAPPDPVDSYREYRRDRYSRAGYPWHITKVGLVLLAALLFVPKPFGKDFAITVNLILCGAIVYGLIRRRFHFDKTYRDAAMPMGAQGVGGSPEQQPIPVFTRGADDRAPEFQRTPSSGTARPWPILDADTPRFISLRQRMSELALSLTYASFCTALITWGVNFFGSLFVDNTQVAEFAGTTLIASWLILAQSKLWEGTKIDSGKRRAVLALTGAVVGVLAWNLDHFLAVQFPSEHARAAINRVGSYSLLEPGTSNQPSVVGFVVFFVGLMGLRKWWRQTDSFRSKQLAIGSTVVSALLGLALASIFTFPTLWGTVWAATISATVQLSAAWVHPRDRVAMMEAANHA